MNDQDMALNNLILKVKTGSHLYGTETETSDDDYIGIFIPDEEYTLGLKHIEQVDLSIESKDESGRNTSQAVDYTVYTLSKFANLSLQNNPNILEVLYINPDYTEHINEYGRSLLSIRDRFLSEKLIDRFYKYAVSQKHKMFLRSGNYLSLNHALDFLEGFDGNMLMVELNNKQVLDKILTEQPNITIRFNKQSLPTALYYKDSPKPFMFIRYSEASKTPKFYDVGDINIQANHFVKKARKYIKNRLNKFSHRGKNIIAKYSYDTKFAYHLIRLLLECEEFIDTGKVEFPLSYAGYLKEIKLGAYSLEELVAQSEKIERRIKTKTSGKNSTLKKLPDFNLINQFIIDIYKKFYGYIKG
jgi:uncharacterized protein